ncbi:tRNA methyltransferase 10 homolog C [Thalassophryne amazonica]|uniref:tRNA methyltransferase 10 homolog C n=1 Tax=Thalassophryne amazonica TaxID=390379 RepID=UPI0014713648|nr:tRNA methyltransferase 10 homolog C [Thalassophryne amazonica]
MMRLLSSGVVWKCGCLLSHRLKPKQTSSFVSVRGFSDGTRDVSLPNPDKPEETQSIDLDKWKSVMKSQALLGKREVDGTDVLGDDEPPDSPEVQAAWRLFTMWREAGRVVPAEITDEQIQTLAELPSKSAKVKYLKFLFIKEGHKLKQKKKQEQRRAEKEVLLSEQKGAQTLQNSFLLNVWFQVLEKGLLWRVAQAMQFGQPLIFDMSYESNMNSRELANSVSQLMDAEAWNRRAAEPFHLYYCNLQPDGAYAKQLVKRYTAEGWNRLLLTCTDRQHVDVFPRENLVYLTADSPNVLHTYDHTKVYIIGAMVDRSIQPGVTLASAKRLNLATARLPLDKYLNWMVGGKNLTLDQMIRIMLTVKETGKWEEAFKFVPQRKHGGFHQQQPVKSVASSSRLRELGHQGVRMAAESSSRFAERNGGRINKEGQSLYFQEQSWSPGVTRDRMHRLTSDGRNEAPVTRTQTSSQTDSPRKRVAKRRTVWWDSE